MRVTDKSGRETKGATDKTHKETEIGDRQNTQGHRDRRQKRATNEKVTDLWGRQTKNGDRPKRVRDIRGTQTKESKRQKKSRTTKGDGRWMRGLTAKK